MVTNNTKQNLINQTRQMIDSTGLDSVSLRELGKVMGLSRSAVYRYFKSKEALLAMIALEDIKFLYETFDLLIQKANNPKKAFHDMVYQLYEFGVNHHDRYSLIFHKKWEGEEYQEFHSIAFQLYGVIQTSIEKYQSSSTKTSLELTAITSAFTVGLIELNHSGHLEQKKGLDSQITLLESFIELLFK